MNIILTESPESADIDFLTQAINQEAPKEYGSAHPFAFFARSEDDSIIAGCNGSVIYGTIYTDQLWVDPKHRKSGIGRWLMECVHKYAIAKDCRIATVATMSFQNAQSFYEKLGYTVDYARAGYANEAICLFLSKRL
ncbi:MAG: GNAT family N-acetyltransferase [Proteobacteria bacterium]|nr:GNAT family N-acetyltransferase [Pseudomonadota bacterium]